MEIEQDPTREAAVADAIRRMEWEGPAMPGEIEVGSNPTTHPLRRGRIAPEATSGIAEKPLQQVRP